MSRVPRKYISYVDFLLMVLNYFKITVIKWQVINCYQIIWVPLTLIFCYTNIQDLYSRVLVNDFFVNSFYYLWTSFWYIPLLLFYLVLTFWRHDCVNYKLKFWLILGLLIIITSDILNYWILNLNNTLVLTHLENFNNLLSNSVNKYHPGIFYMTSLPIVCFIFFKNTLQVTSLLHFSSYIYYKYVRSLVNKNLKLITFTIFLGGWWALQEGSWGGWWNWDPSEVFGLLFIFIYAWQVHRIWSKHQMYSIINNQIILFYCTFLIYIFIQLNFDLVSHNFGTKTNQFIDAIQFFGISLCVVGLILIQVNFKQFYILQFQLSQYYIGLPYDTFWKINFKRAWITIISFIVTIQLCLSFSPLLNDFLWKLASINITNVDPNWIYYNYMLYLMLILFFWLPQVEYFLIFMWSFCLPYCYFFVILFLYFSVNRFTFIHIILLTSLQISTINSIWVISHWSFLGINFSLNSTNWIYTFYDTLKLNNNFIELTNFYLNEVNLTSTFNFLLNDSTSEVYSFIFWLIADLQQQSLILGSLFTYYQINTYDFLPQSLFVLFTSWLLILLYNKRCTEMIIF